MIDHHKTRANVKKFPRATKYNKKDGWELNFYCLKTVKTNLGFYMNEEDLEEIILTLSTLGYVALGPDLEER
jgi:hypothetical protein